MTEIEIRDVRELARALQRVEWVDGKCPWCSRPQAYGLHVCSCPRRLALRAAARILGTDQLGQSDPAAQRLVDELRTAAACVRGEWGLTDETHPSGTLLEERAADVIALLL